MKSRLMVLVGTLVLTSLLLGACTLPTFGPFETSGYTATVDFPISGAVYGLGAQVSLVGEADYASSQPAATSLTFWGNGTQLGGAVTDLDVSSEGGQSDANDGYAPPNWTPPSPGQYQIQVQALMSNGRQAISNPVQICVLDFAFPPLPSGEAGDADGASGYTGPCPLPPAPASSAAVSIMGQATPASLVYSVTDDPTTCTPPASDVITFQASANDPGSRIALVIVIIHVAGSPDSIVLNETPGSVAPTRTFTGSYDAGGTLQNLVDSSGHGISGDLIWDMHAYGRDGTLLASDGPHSIPAAPCSGAPGPLAPPPPPPASVSPTPASASPTPASAQDCPAGTYFADVTHQCIAISTPTPPKVGKSCNLSQAVCNLQKKKFNPATCSCQ